MTTTEAAAPPPLFVLGQLVATPNALDVMHDLCEVFDTTETKGVADTLIERHETGDWGDVDAEDATINDEAVKHGGRILSAYIYEPTGTIWIITEADRSATTLLLPSDY